MTHQIPLSYGILSPQAFRLETAKGDHIGNIVAKTGTFYEIAVLERHLALFGAPKTVVDIGANIGNHSLFWSGVCGAKVVAFEPHPAIHEILERNIRHNGLGGSITPINVACGNATGAVEMEIPVPSNMGTSRISQALDRKVRTATARQIRLDEFAPLAEGSIRPDLIKIDTEGYELEVLLGACAALERDRPNLWIETSADRCERCFELLFDLGYCVFGPPIGSSDNYLLSTRPLRNSSALRAFAYDTTRKIRQRLGFRRSLA